MTIKYSEGDCFVLELRSGGFARGVIARTSRGGGVVQVYIFGPRLQAVPSDCWLDRLSPDDAVLVARVGDLSVSNGDWPVVGRIQKWERDAWPAPPYVRRDDIRRMAWLVRYDDSDISCVSTEEPLAFERVGEFDRDAVLGAGAVEIVVTKRLLGTDPDGARLNN